MLSLSYYLKIFFSNNGSIYNNLFAGWLFFYLLLSLFISFDLYLLLDLCGFDALLTNLSCLFTPGFVVKKSNPDEKEDISKAISSSMNSIESEQSSTASDDSSSLFFPVAVAKTFFNLKTEATINLIKLELKGLTGIYAFKHKVSGKMYIGSSVNLWSRFKEHLGNKHSNIHLQRAFVKYGLDQFNFIVLEFCTTDKLIELEQKYLNLVSDKYNICPIAGSSLGRKHTDEAKAKIGMASRGRKFSEETLAKFRERTHSEETIAKLKARRHSGEIKKKISDAMTGKTRSEESKAKYRAAAIIRENNNTHYKAVSITVIDLENNITTVYKSIGKAALALGGSKSGLNYALNSQKLYLGRYKITTT